MIIKSEVNNDNIVGEVAGSLLLGLTQSFKHLTIFPIQLNNINPLSWYPYSYFTDTLISIQKTLPSKNILFQSGVNFLQIWYEQGPGKNIIFSSLDWLHANDSSGGYNTVVRGGTKDEIGWCLLQSIDEEAGIAIYENVMPMLPDYIRGVFYAGCLLFDDMEYVEVEITSSEPYKPNSLFLRTIITVNFRLKQKNSSDDLEARISNLKSGSNLSLTSQETESLVWRYKSLKNKSTLKESYLCDINTVLFDEKEKTEKLLEEQRQLLTLFDKSDTVLFKWNNDKEWSVDYVSDNIDKLLNYTKEEFLKNKISYGSFIHEDDVSFVLQEVEYAIKHNLDFLKHQPYRIVLNTGEIKWIMDHTVTQKDYTGKITHFIGTIRDITERENIFKNLQKFIDTQDTMVILINGDDITFANKKFFDFLGFENLEDFKGFHSSLSNLFLENDRFFHSGKVKKGQTWLESLSRLLHSERIVCMLKHNRQLHAFSVTINNFDENLKIVSFTDITQTILEHIQLEEKTIHDKLTDAYNREFFEQNYVRLIEDFTRSDHHLAIALIDIDHFKMVNDTYGHDVGDEVLKQFVKTINKYSREEDILIRWGGEEFILILKVKSIDNLKKALEHIRHVIELEDFYTVGTKTCSIGASIYQDGEEIKRTIKRADEAVYDAKANGRNQVVLKI